MKINDFLKLQVGIPPRDDFSMEQVSRFLGKTYLIKTLSVVMKRHENKGFYPPLLVVPETTLSKES